MIGRLAPFLLVFAVGCPKPPPEPPSPGPAPEPPDAALRPHGLGDAHEKAAGGLAAPALADLRREHCQALPYELGQREQPPSGNTGKLSPGHN